MSYTSINEELEKALGREPTQEELDKVVAELPEAVSRKDIRRIVGKIKV